MKRLRLFFVLTSGALAAGACGSFGSTPEPSPSVDGGANPPTNGDASVDGAVPPSSPPTTPPAVPPGTPPPVDAGDGCPPPGDGGPCPAGGTVWNGRCYFVTGGFATLSQAQVACAEQGAELATFTCAAEWVHAHPVGQSNYVLGAQWDGAEWVWLTGEPWGYVPPGTYFDGGPPNPPSMNCIWSNKGADWMTASCTANSANAYCEK